MTASGRDAVKVGRDDLGVVTLSINRPDRMNALDHQTVGALIDLITTHGADPATRAIVLAGEGGAFTTGADLQAIRGSDGDAPGPSVTMDNAAALVRAVLAAPIPVIAAVTGPAAGVGVSLALASDLMLMADDAYLLFAFTNIGLMPDGGPACCCPRRSAGRSPRGCCCAGTPCRPRRPAMSAWPSRCCLPRTCAPPRSRSPAGWPGAPGARWN